MNKYVVGGILAVISLLAIFGASASNRVVRWADNPNGKNAPLVGLNDSETASNQPATADRELVAQVNEAEQTPLQRAGQFPQRQAFTEADGQTTEVIEINRDNATPVAEADTETTTPAVPAQPANTQPAPTVTNNPQPVRALW